LPVSVPVPAREGILEQAVHTRTSARLAAVQALYQVAMTGRPAATVVDEFLEHRLGNVDQELGDAGIGQADEGLFCAVALGAARDLDAIDTLIVGALTKDWSFDRLESTLVAILRVGTHELLSHGETPRAVVIDEYVNVANAFYDAKGTGLVNGVLDRIARLVRKDEVRIKETKNDLKGA